MKRQRGNGGIVATGHVIARETSIVETIRIDVRRKGPAEAVGLLVQMFDRIQRGWHPVAIEVELEKGVAEYSSPWTGAAAAGASVRVQITPSARSHT